MPPQERKIPIKANRVLNLVLIAFVVIIARIWHLTVVQHDSREEEARRPQSRTVIEPGKRGSIVDHFGIPLAINRIQYNAAILYAPIRQISAVRWELDSNGNRVRRYKRKEYISDLAKIISDVLSLEAVRVEDLIHSKGALYNQIPFVLKEEISEKEYYELKALERDWPGIHVQKVPRRFYPLGRVAGDVIGYMGAISRNEYEKIIREIAFLQKAIDDSAKTAESAEPLPIPEGFESIEEVEERLQKLRDKAYTLTDYVGKTGVEGSYERELRGSCGRKSYCSDARGNYLKELPGANPALSGRKLQLSISAELQEFAEKLLIQNEQIRETRVQLIDATQRKLMALKKPWIKGGAIVVLDPNSGAVLTLASHPRFDPNDFILSGNSEINRVQRGNIQRWFETESYLADIWDQKRPLQREYYNYSLRTLSEESKTLTWEMFIDIILPSEGTAATILKKQIDVPTAVKIISAADSLKSRLKNESLETILQAFTVGGELPSLHLDKGYKTAIQNALGPILIPMNEPKDRVLLIDLCRLAVDEKRFTPSLIKEVSGQSLSSYRDASSALIAVEEVARSMAKDLFHDNHFIQWRTENEKQFLKEKREEEKLSKRYAKPYIDLLDAKEKELFQVFWRNYKWPLIETLLFDSTSTDISKELDPYRAHFSCWYEEIQQGAHEELSWHSSYMRLKALLASISPFEQLAYLQSLRGYNDLNRPLHGNYSGLHRADPQLEKHLAAAFYPLYGYGYGRSHAYRQSTTQGSIFKLVTAHEALLQKFRTFGIKQPSMWQLNPLEINETTFTHRHETFLGYHSDGKPLPRFYKGGRLPRSVNANLGKIGLIDAIESSSNPYFSLLAGDILNSPNDLAEASKRFGYGSRTGIDLPAEIAGKVPSDLDRNRTGLYSMAIGQHTLVVTPLQTSIMLASIANGGRLLTPWIVSSNNTSQQPRQLLPMPSVIRKMLIEGMRRVMAKSQAESLFSLSRLYQRHPEAISDYVDCKDCLIGKTGTAESIERIDLDSQRGVNMYNHVWFGGISFSQKDNEAFVLKDSGGQPELVVVVYLRYGGFGKEAGPIAAQIVAKWQELQAKYSEVP
jgi:cell division protein FtsI/penicillin-binding protein 2